MEMTEQIEQLAAEIEALPDEGWIDWQLSDDTSGQLCHIATLKALVVEYRLRQLDKLSRVLCREWLSTEPEVALELPDELPNEVKNGVRILENFYRQKKV